MVRISSLQNNVLHVDLGGGEPVMILITLFILYRTLKHISLSQTYQNFPVICCYNRYIYPGD